MKLLDDIRNHWAVLNEGQKQRRTAVLLREALDEIERIREERNRWMINALAHEKVAAELRVRLMETPTTN